MSHYLVELYSPSPAWEILSDDHRRVFLDGIAKGMAELGTLGIEMLTLSEVASDVPRSTHHRFVGIWRFPDATARDALLQGIHDSGWYRYFHHVNAATQEGELGEHLNTLASYR
ncbi:hypothetical protein LGM63_32600 [Burkholderia cepacia]|uniref:DUF6616 family protein n=1 Tax=Burkholderia TaxID=32008 RepID=UPI00075E28DC|nr:DUF6616 family protein [Burkholderia cepacia]KWC73692.1 hypothetical protein WL57_36550 [Burkholderia cepacia]MCA7995392.1 hypothetical protein [Burkholderia cepacia]MCA8352730.1 hypothetical protein [Burkholderia cepacia]NHB09076.1 hypothetical protein [Burkholderia cepacia]RRA08427.1 hypothetical protein DF054_15420 [Burkholderia cepacia]